MSAAGTTTARAKYGLETRRAILLPVTGQKRRKLLVLIAAYIDAGRADPSIRELSKRLKLQRFVVIALVDALERDGLLTVQRASGERNRYALIGGAE